MIGFGVAGDATGRLARGGVVRVAPVPEEVVAVDPGTKLRPRSPRRGRRALEPPGATAMATAMAEAFAASAASVAMPAAVSGSLVTAMPPTVTGSRSSRVSSTSTTWAAEPAALARAVGAGSEAVAGGLGPAVWAGAGLGADDPQAAKVSTTTRSDRGARHVSSRRMTGNRGSSTARTNPAVSQNAGVAPLVASG